MNLKLIYCSLCLLSIYLMIFLSADASAVNVGNCTVLSTPNTFYQQTANLVPNGSLDSCIQITGENITFDGNGFSIRNTSAALTGILSDQFNTTILNVNITLGGGTGINIDGGTFSTIRNSRIYNATDAISIQNADVVVLDNLTIFTLEDTGVTGVKLSSTTNANISNLNISSLTQTGDGSQAVYLSGSSHNRLSNLTIHGFDWSVYFSSSSNNTVIGSYAYSDAAGIYLLSGSSDNVFRNLFEFNFNEQALGVTNSHRNVFSDFNFTNSTGTFSGAVGVFVASGSSNNLIANGTISGFSGAGISISGGSENNIIYNVSSTNFGGFGLSVEAGSNYTQIVDSYFANYSFGAAAGSKPTIRKIGVGEIRFLESISGNGTNFSRDIYLANNFAEVRSDFNSGLNKSANITLYGIATGLTNYKILRNGIECNSATVPSCYALTSLNAGTVVFNVSSWSNYSIYGQEVDTDSGSDGASSGGGGRSAASKHFWLATFLYGEIEEAQISRALFVRQRIKINVSGDEHYVGIVNLTDVEAVINISSDSQQVVLRVRENKSIDLDSDNYYDLNVKLESIFNKQASLTVSYLHEPIPRDSVSGSDERLSEGAQVGLQNKGVYLAAVIVITLLLVFFILFGRMRPRRKKRK